VLSLGGCSIFSSTDGDDEPRNGTTVRFMFRVDNS
jgi:hypothetical protein